MVKVRFGSRAAVSDLYPPEISAESGAEPEPAPADAGAR
jgi:hypothetical protein